MSEQNISAVRRFFDAFNAHDLEKWDEVSSPNFVAHDPALPVADSDLPTIKQIIGDMQAALPDIKTTEEDIIVAEDKVVVRRSFSGTHKGELMGIPASDKAVTYTGIFIFRLSGGKVEELWVNWDTVGLLQQIGAVPKL